MIEVIRKVNQNILYWPNSSEKERKPARSICFKIHFLYLNFQNNLKFKVQRILSFILWSKSEKFSEWILISFKDLLTPVTLQTQSVTR